MQFNVPQFIETEDKLIGPLTLKQFLYLAAGGLCLFFIWYFFRLWLFVIIAVPIVALALALAFLKINGRPFGQVLLAFIIFSTKQKLYLWKREEK